MEEFNLNAAWHSEKKADCEPELAQACVPFQKWGRLYDPEEGLKKGTVFPALYRPYRKKILKRTEEHPSIHKMEGGQ